VIDIHVSKYWPSWRVSSYAQKYSGHKILTFLQYLTPYMQECSDLNFFYIPQDIYTHSRVDGKKIFLKACGLEHHVVLCRIEGYFISDSM
jgi:hypothetical protein